MDSYLGRITVSAAQPPVAVPTTKDVVHLHIAQAQSLPAGRTLRAQDFSAYAVEVRSHDGREVLQRIGPYMPAKSTAVADVEELTIGEIVAVNCFGNMIPALRLVVLRATPKPKGMVYDGPELIGEVPIPDLRDGRMRVFAGWTLMAPNGALTSASLVFRVELPVHLERPRLVQPLQQIVTSGSPKVMGTNGIDLHGGHQIQVTSPPLPQVLAPRAPSGLGVAAKVRVQVVRAIQIDLVDWDDVEVWVEACSPPTVHVSTHAHRAPPSEGHRTEIYAMEQTPQLLGACAIEKSPDESIHLNVGGEAETRTGWLRVRLRDAASDANLETHPFAPRDGFRFVPIDCVMQDGFYEDILGDTTSAARGALLLEATWASHAVHEVVPKGVVRRYVHHPEALPPLPQPLMDPVSGPACDYSAAVASANVRQAAPPIVFDTVRTGGSPIQHLPADFANQCDRPVSVPFQAVQQDGVYHAGAQALYVPRARARLNRLQSAHLGHAPPVECPIS